MVLGESVGDIVPHHRGLREFHSLFECFQSVIFFTGVEERLAEADLEFGIVWREDGGFIEFRDGFGIFVLREEKRSEGGVGHGIERIYCDLFAESVGGLGKFLLLLQCEAQVIVNMLVVGIGGDLFLECGGGIVELAEAQVGEA